MENNDIEFIDPTESSGSYGNKGFSYNELIMNAISRCNQYLSREMTAGYWNEKLDKYGNVTRFYVNDARKMFIGSVKALLYSLDDGTDESDEIKEIKVLLEQIKGLKEKYLKMEADDWNTAPRIIRDLRMKDGLRYRAGLFCSKLPYENEYLMEMVEIYEQILNKLIIIAREQTKDDSIMEGYS